MQKTRFHLLGKSGPGNQIYMKNGRHFPATREEIHYNYKLKWASRNSPGISGISPDPAKLSGNGARSAITTHTTSRAGGQDYGSFN